MSGDAQRRGKDVTRFEGTSSYVATTDLKVAVNAAITLERPLLVKGEPGTGKTVLAIEIARSIGAPLLEWHIKSTTKAQQGLYEYDAVSRLRDSQLGDERVRDIRNYIKRGKLWDAFIADERPVLLIDEIDKADIEFPNDLLQELDRMEFYVYETGETVHARRRPIVIITSNNEKELPDAFLRRCFFHYIRFPDAETMRAIIAVHFPSIKQRLVSEALTIFYEIRDVPGLKKKPSTSELLDWLKLLMVEDIGPETLRERDPKKLIPPLHGALLKNEQDVHLFERLGARVASSCSERQPPHGERVRQAEAEGPLIRAAAGPGYDRRIGARANQLFVFNKSVGRPGRVEPVFQLCADADRLPAAARVVDRQSARDRFVEAHAVIGACRPGGDVARSRTARDRDRWRHRDHGVHEQPSGHAVAGAKSLHHLGARAQPGHCPIIHKAADVHRRTDAVQPVERRAVVHVALPDDIADRTKREHVVVEYCYPEAVDRTVEFLR
jgi:MoxR-like ATPase